MEAGEREMRSSNGIWLSSRRPSEVAACETLARHVASSNRGEWHAVVFLLIFSFHSGDPLHGSIVHDSTLPRHHRHSASFSSFSFSSSFRRRLRSVMTILG